MNIKSGLVSIKSDLGFTYTMDYKSDNNTWAMLEHGIHFDNVQEALDWVRLYEAALIEHHEAMYQD